MSAEVGTEVTMEDGTAAGLVDHLAQDHGKGTRGFTARYLTNLHEALHDRKRDPLPEHTHPAVDIPRQPAAPAES